MGKQWGCGDTFCLLVEMIRYWVQENEAKTFLRTL